MPAASAFSIPLALTILAWGFNFVALKLLYSHMTPAVVGLARWALMLVALLVVCTLMRLRPAVPRRDVPATMLQGMLSLGLYMVFFLEGTERTGAAEAAIVLSTAPILTALFAALARQETLKGSFLLWSGVAFAGVALVASGAGNGRSSLVGMALVFASSVVWATSTVLSKPLVGRSHPISMLTASMWGALPILLIYGGSQTWETNWRELPSEAWFLLAYVALCAGALGFAGFYAGVRQVGAAGAMVYQYLVAPLAALFSWIVLGKPLSPLSLVGMALVLGGVAMASRSRIARFAGSEVPLPPPPD